jgi:hypothetical protein
VSDRQSETDRLVESFRSCTLPKDEWTHHAHLRVGLWHLVRYSPSESLYRLRQNIMKYNIACGIENTDSQGYHETITQFGSPAYMVISIAYLNDWSETEII